MRNCYYLYFQHSPRNSSVLLLPHAYQPRRHICRISLSTLNTHFAKAAGHRRFLPLLFSRDKMVPDAHTPIIIGVGDVKNRSPKVDDAIEPMQLMLQAISRALEDSTMSRTHAEELKSSIDSISIVATWTWPYADLPGLLAAKLGIQPRHKIYSKHGGNQPIKLVDEAARRISRGECKVAVVTGGEALASCMSRIMKRRGA